METTSHTSTLPFYQSVGDECTLFEVCHSQKLPLMLKGPTGCGKSRFIEHMAARMGRQLITVPCHDDTSATDLLGRWLIRGGDTVWQDGPVTRAVREGAILYLDEIAEARPDVVVALHPLTDHRRELYLDRHNETLTAGDDFMMVVSFNPQYQHGLKELKPSTRQRFVGASFDYPSAELEASILVGETGVEEAVAKRLVRLAGKLRGLDELGLAESASTRLLVDACRLLSAGMTPRAACQAAILEPLTDEPEVLAALREVVALAF
ncbi:MAG: CbbQ/NirQ/NorQ/GpvN family protein [Planctomycetes bacterium]|jgi:nitric oxide reductase NorQ protein|nr:CbbQ/NirQ/NorQ/GpvN family protein [Planctomycetota bacterium]MBT4027872.1 CbbQ/NirQ/NorQ/GpvN family protein [Planctomycetota bacterium]MBT4559333.1 CbbQ/NirQ/NorQ/GpvN family protein [Planctomycetota bacterium]MBT5101735.1 CbbQ/NirQ/NorQ/GpvN family protein [Planctomycetota bacterium]MBT5120064.1 CbbQ/NirQ/NorQ/GpvN family protein [Planctomycetota bacterium]